MNSSKITSELKAYDIMEDNIKKVKTEIKKSVEEKYKNVIERLTTEMNDKEKPLRGYINSNWSFKLVDSTCNYRIWIGII